MDRVTREEDIPGEVIHPEKVFQVQKLKEVLLEAQRFTEERPLLVSVQADRKTERMHQGYQDECLFDRGSAGNDHEEEQGQDKHPQT